MNGCKIKEGDLLEANPIETTRNSYLVTCNNTGFRCSVTIGLSVSFASVSQQMGFRCYKAAKELTLSGVNILEYHHIHFCYSNIDKSDKMPSIPFCIEQTNKGVHEALKIKASGIVKVDQLVVQNGNIKPDIETVYSLLDSKNESQVQEGLHLWSELDKAAHDKFVSEWQAWADLFEMSLCEYLAKRGRFVINCAYMELTELPALPSTLKELCCYDNQLKALPELPSELQILSCQNNQLTALPALPEALQRLGCYDNQLTALPALPSALKILYCHYNQLTLLPTLPSELQILSCQNNQLKALPTLPSTLQELYCYDNHLTALPALPSTLQILDLRNNHLTKNQ